MDEMVAGMVGPVATMSHVEYGRIEYQAIGLAGQGAFYSRTFATRVEALEWVKPYRSTSVRKRYVGPWEDVS